VKTLVTVHLVQFSLWDYESFEIRPGGTGIIGPNGAGKTSLVDAVQIAMVGGHGQHLHFNAQSVHKDARSLRAYSLGTMRSGEGDKGVITRKRDEALSYITLVFKGQAEADVFSAGICIHATTTDQRVMGLYVLPGVALKLEHHLEDLGAQGKAPIDWELFAELGRSQTRAMGRTATITTRPETYLHELLHNVQQGLDVRKFLRAFGHSIDLKAVSSVGDFLRGYLVEATPIDKRGTLQHIKTLRTLGRQIEEVTSQVARLEDIERRYQKVCALHRQAAVAIAARLQLEVEAADASAGKLDAEISDLRAELLQATQDLPHHEQQHRTLNDAYENLLQALNADPEQQQPGQLAQLRTARQTSLTQARKDIDRLSLQLREALLEATLVLEIHHPEQARAVEGELARWDGWAKAGHLASLEQLNAGLSVLAACEREIGRERPLALQLEQEAKRIAEEAKARLQAVSQGKRITDSNVARAGALFDAHGIAYQPVAAAVRVTDSRWQGPIETFLGPHRLALVVESGREDDAVELIRRERIDDVTVVQPEHLREDIGRPVAPDAVAALLEGADPVALAYLRRILGKMKRVQTAQELRREPRALTTDYMLSANGGTKRIRPLEEARWMLGMKLTNDDRVAAVEGNRKAMAKAHEATQYVGQLDRAHATALAAVQQVTLAAYTSAVTSHSTAQTQLNAAADPSAMPVSERLKELRLQVNRARQQSVDAGLVVGQLRDTITRSETALKTLEPQCVEAKRKLAGLQASQSAVLQDPDCDHDLLPKEYDRLAAEIEARGFEAAIVEHQRRQQQLAAQIQTAGALARDGFLEFINEHSIGLVDERSDWRKAHGWVQGHIRKLRDSTLMGYRDEAAKAREAAEQSFRSDVKFKMREAIQRVRQEIRDLNHILQSCPAFTNGEKYQFVANVSPAHKALYELIIAAPEGEGPLDLFGQQEVQAKLLELLENSESGNDKGNNPLEDYRLLFNFDLQILQDGVVVDYLSKRMGVASNGEHRVPFYVIAGAALATAYRIRPGGPHFGAGLMILDEAFYGMDAQNTFVTANFLKSLGLQLLMAGPDSDVGKLAPLMDNYYDLARYGADVFAEHVVVKPAAQELLTSDIPLLHPELVDAAEREFAAERARA